MTFRIPALALAVLLAVAAGCGDGADSGGDAPDFSEMDEFETLAYAYGFEAALGLKRDSATFKHFSFDVFSEGFRDGLAGDSSRIAYLLGYQVGNQLRQDTVGNLDSERFLAGFRSGLVRDSSGISDEELRRISGVVQDSIQMRQLRIRARTDTSVANRLRSGRQNEAAAARFLAEVEGRDGIVKTESGLLYQITEAGEGEAPQNETDVVTINYKGMLADGTVFDQNEGVTQALGGFVEGFTEGLQNMKVGGKRTLYIPPSLGYGMMSPPNIPPNSVLVFEVELVDVMTLQEAGAPMAPPPPPVPAQ